MGKLSNRLLASALMVIALSFCARAIMIFQALVSLPQNFVPAPKGPDGCSVCPPHTLFSAETEQTLTILVSLVVIAMAWMLWNKSSAASH
jgi:hypothetical protein